MRFCTTCGSELADPQQFCTSCGAARPSAPATTQLPVPPPAPAAAAPPPGYERPAAPPPPPPGAWTAAVGPRVPEEHRRRNRGAVLAAVVLTLIALGSWGYVLLDRTGWLEDEPRPASASDDRSKDEDRDDEAAPEPTEEPDEPEPTPAQEVELGAMVPSSVTADCVAPPAKDSTGATVTYEPELVLDGRNDTAWRCPGSAVGKRLVFTFDEPVTLVDIGLVPGYDKVDPADGIDRFSENRTVTGVVWRTDDGRSFPQSIPSPGREMALLDVREPLTTKTLVLEITSTGNDGARRDFTPISEVELTGY